VQFDTAGALWLDEGRTLLAADLHLGYGWAQRRRGESRPTIEEETKDAA
jgi:metallophosphoesterase superfamily enzyme